nr:immunoglobulin heavy chain junction region [Macaca mulatta]MOW76089.1 immunoglobulin heavy chain junction region [Macaca mulatta]MOW80097.1 immunoglobulin heavy chain junction region [Macaca mulatta]MOW80386.1 immunoglobulin heavy chain junction region [Macaca mulatta]MOW81576.1 immunoglobulin heavy chain junction region [Macaca mulatta]
CARAPLGLFTALFDSW